jgi:hypothetical protein
MFQSTLQSATLVSASGTTGTICQKSGPYKCTTTPQVTMFIKKGQKFPGGPVSGSTKTQKTTWNMVK